MSILSYRGNISCAREKSENQIEWKSSYNFSLPYNSFCICQCVDDNSEVVVQLEGLPHKD